MQSTLVIPACRFSRVSTTTSMMCAVILGFAGLAMTLSPAAALVGGIDRSLQRQNSQINSIVHVYARRGGMARRTTVVGPRGGVASRTVVRRGAAVRPGVVRPNVVRTSVVRTGVVAGRGRWVRPARYYWRPGGAIAAGAAIGFVTAATAAAWAGAPPVAGYCWYYTDATQTQGFWDVCP
jgi:hypothetical protein